MELSLEERVERLEDESAIRKLMGKYVYYAYGGAWQRVPPLFAGREDIWVDCEGFGIFDGAAGIERFFVQWHRSMEFDGKGIFALHPLTTDVIEVAADGKTARGLWISPGAESRLCVDTGGHDAFWMWGMYAVDFIKEDGEWRFWHFRIPHLMMCDYHNSWVEVCGKPGRVKHAGRPKADRPTGCAETWYDVDKKPTMFFEPPHPYETEAQMQGFWKKDNDAERGAE